LKRKNPKPLIRAAPGMVKIQVKNISMTFRQFTLALLSTAPIPVIAEEITWVVLRGTPEKLYKIIIIAEEISAEKP
jgi:hypothetical protein